MADGLHGVWPCVDDGQHGGDDAEEDGGHHGGDGADVELVHHQLPLMVHDPLGTWRKETVRLKFSKQKRDMIYENNEKLFLIHKMNIMTEMQPKDVRLKSFTLNALAYSCN